jgi:hypothetical protein
VFSNVESFGKTVGVFFEYRFSAAGAFIEYRVALRDPSCQRCFEEEEEEGSQCGEESG